MSKRVLSMLLALCLLVCCLPMAASAVAASGDCSKAGDGSVTWKVENNTLTISGTGAVKDYPPLFGPLVGPGEAAGDYVAPWHWYSFKKAVIGAGITSVPGGLFWCDNDLESIVVEEGNANLFSYDGALYENSKVYDYNYETGEQLSTYKTCVVLSCIPDAKTGVLHIKEGAHLARGYGSNGAFIQAKKLTGIEFPSTWWTTFKEHGEWSFDHFMGRSALHCPSPIVSYTISPNHPEFKSVNGSIYTKDGRTLCMTPPMPANNELVVADGTTKILDLGNIDRRELTKTPLKITIPRSVTEIEQEAVYFQEISGVREFPIEISGYAGSLAESYARECGVKFTDIGNSVGGFHDVPAGEYYAKPVEWAVGRGITQGETATSFAPNKTCTRGQIVTFLWRANGSPEPSSTTNPFVDVKSGDYFYKAVLWAKEKGITGGTDATHFSPNSSCIRGDAVTFLWRANNKPTGTGTTNFTDVKSGAYYADAVKWASGKGVTQGDTATTFAPGKSCTRGQIVTFLYRDLA